MPQRLPQNRLESPGREQDPDQEAIEAFAERLNLKEQYLAQIKVLYQSGLLENFVAPTAEHLLPELGVIGIDGKEYILPSYEDLLERLKDSDKRARLEQKFKQGFTKLQLVPFALPLTVLIDRYRQTLLKIHHGSGLKATDGSTLELDENHPLHVWEDLLQCDNPDTSPDKQIEYGVTNYDGQTKAERGGHYKSELLRQDPANGWQFSLIEDRPDLPAQNQGRIVSGRKQFEAEQTPKDYLKLFLTQDQYRGEAGQTPESALITQLTYLQKNQTVIDDWQGRGKANWLVGNRLSGYVPWFSWYRGNRQAYLYRGNPDNRNSVNGFRPAARF